MYTEIVKVVELTLEDGSKMLCRGGEVAVRRAWNIYPVVSAKWTGEEQLMQWVEYDESLTDDIRSYGKKYGSIMTVGGPGVSFRRHALQKEKNE